MHRAWGGGVPARALPPSQPPSRAVTTAVHPARLLVMVALLAHGLSAQAPTTRLSPAAIEQLIAAMSVEEKISMVAGCPA
jgi:hypothetical protein